MALLVAVVAMVSVLSACSEEEPTEFSADNQEAFMAACSQPVEDSRLISGICQCVIEEALAQLEFTEFAETDERLVVNPDAELPQQITDIIADCVIEETGL